MINLSSLPREESSFTWSIELTAPPNHRLHPKYQGTLILDVDGTLTIPGKQYAVDHKALEVLADFLIGGGNLIFCTGATRGRTERTVLAPLYNIIEKKDPGANLRDLFERVYLMPENGSVLLINHDIVVVENELRFHWHQLHPLYTPDMNKLRSLFEKELLPRYPGSFIAGNQPEDRVEREYTISIKGFPQGAPLEVIKELKETTIPQHREIDWNNIGMKAARTTIDFVHAQSGKTISVSWVLRNVGGLEGPVAGFGDLGDEFASVVPTFNVNKNKPNEFRLRGMPSMELTKKWQILSNGNYVTTGTGSKAKVRRTDNDQEVQVLRTSDGKILLCEESSKGYLVPSTGSRGRPVEIVPLEIGDASEGTSWMIKRLMESSYFEP